MEENTYTVYLDGNELGSVLEDVNFSNGGEAELLVSTLGAVARNKKPATVKAKAVSSLDVPANGQLEFGVGASGKVGFSVPRAGLYLGILIHIGAAVNYAVWSIRFPCGGFTFHRDTKLLDPTNYRVRYKGPPSPDGKCVFERTEMSPNDFQRIALMGLAQVLDPEGNALGHPVITPGKPNVPSTAPPSIYYAIRFVGLV